MDQKELKEKMDALEKEFSEMTIKESIKQIPIEPDPRSQPVSPTEPLPKIPAELTRETEPVSEADPEPSAKPREKKPKKKSRRVWGILLAVFLILAAVSAVRDFLGAGGSKGEVPLTVSDGAGSSVIASQLKNAGIIRHPFLFKLYTRTQKDVIYQKGTHYVSDSMSYSDLLEVLSSTASLEESTRKIVIPEGFELRQIVDLLVENGLGDEATFYHEIENGSFDFAFLRNIPRTENRLEGYLYPDTYLFSVEESEHEIINRMLEAFQEKVIPVFQSYSTEKSLDEILIFASVIEREAANDQERPLVASVFENRLEKGMKLESCATVQYILKERKTVLSNADTAMESPYNTYQNTGLPIGPIASPGLPSIEAALSPADTEYLYFLATADGSENLFSKTFEEHNQKLAQTQGA